MLHGLIWVALGSLIGGPARFLVTGLVGRFAGETFPWGTIIVNASGAFAIGAIAAAAMGGGLPPAAWQFLVTGFLGAYTTVSGFSLQTLSLLRDGHLSKAAGNVVLSLVLCLSAVACGYAAGVAAGLS